MGGQAPGKVRMANSRLGIETKAITEGAVMAALTAMLALAGIFIPILDPVVMLVWTLPVVVVCMRHGMRAGAATITVAGFVIMTLSSPMIAANMLIRSVGPAMLIGCGFHYRWRTEKTVLLAALATFLGLLLDYAISVFVMGISIREMFAIEPETVDEMIRIFSEYGLLESFQITAEEMAEYILSTFSLMLLMLPAILLVYSLVTAITNYLTANLLLRKLRIPLPPVTKLSTIRMPIGVVFGFLLGFGLMVLGNMFWPDIELIVTIGQNITVVFLTLYIVQGLGLIFYFIGKTPQSMQGFLKFSLFLVVIMTAFNFLAIIGYIGVADALLDFRRFGGKADQTTDSSG